MQLFKSLAWRIYAAFLFAAVVPTGIAGVIGISFAVDAMRHEAAVALEREVLIRAQGITRFMRQASAEAKLLAESAAVADFARAVAGGDTVGEARMLPLLEREFAALARLHSHVYQVRLLDARGHERVRAERRKDVVSVTPRSELQDKSDRYYFREAMAGGGDALYVSPLDLNIEHGVVERPERPVIRIAATVGPTGESPHGLVIINLHADAVLGPIQEMADARGGDAYLFDSSGHYISRASRQGAKSGDWSVAYPRRPVGELNTVLGPEALQRITGRRTGALSSAGWTIAHAPLAAMAGAQHDWMLALAFPEYRLFDSLFNLYALYTVLAVGVAVTALGGYVLSRRLLIPLRQLAAETAAVADGDFTRRVNVSGDDEIATLGRRFNAMAASLQSFYSGLKGQRERLEAEVRERTHDLERERAFLYALVQHLGDGVLVLTEAGVVRLANARARTMIGLSKDAVGGRIASQWSAWPRVLASLDAGEGAEVLPVGDALIAVTGRRLDDGHRLVVLRDVTEERRIVDDRRELDQQMFQMERMVTFGELAMGLAHEIGNPLAGMKAVAQALQYEEDLPPGVREALRRLENEVDRLTGFLRSFRGFTAQPELVLEACALVPIVEDVLFWIRREARKTNVLIELDGLELAPQLHADRQMLKQVLLNLLMNALHAMPRGGTLSIGVKPGHAAGHCRIEITDTGQGIDPELMTKVFNPFFTTRAEGTGLGLAIVRKIVQLHGARIELSNRAGGGACAALEWPVGKEADRE